MTRSTNDNWDPDSNNITSGGGSAGTSGVFTGGDQYNVPDNVEYGRVMDVISEGPCHGPANGLKSFFLNDTAIQNTDDTLNFSGFILQASKGTRGQKPMFGFDASENEVMLPGGSLGTQIQVATGSYTRQITTAGLTHLRVRISCPALKIIDSATGKESGADTQIKIEVWSDITPVYQVALPNDGFIWGNFSSKYTKSFKFKLPPMNSGGWFIKITRLWPDAPDTYTKNATFWTSYTEIVEGQFIHPWISKASVMLDSHQFTSIPSRAYEWDGRIIKVPTNYTPAIMDPVTRLWTPAVYTGNWDGTFKDSPTVCFNPAWQFHDLCTHPRYGAGKYVSALKINKWALYTIAQYCDGMVDDGTGLHNEPRIATSIYLQRQEDAIKVLTNMAAAFRGMIFYGSSLITPSQDCDKPVWAIFTNSNVKNGVFKYSSTARKARHTTCSVMWNDPSAGYVLVPELVEDQDAVKKYGVQNTSIVALGCTSRGGAVRWGKWTLITEQTETETVEFEPMLEGLAVAPGRIIQINDQFRAGQARNGGRVAAGATTTVVPLDGPVVLEAGKTYTLRVALPTPAVVQLPDGTSAYDEGIALGQSTVMTGAGTVTSLTVSPALSAAPAQYAQWLLADGSVVPELYKVVGVKEGKESYTVIGLEHNTAKFAAADTTGSLSVSAYTPTAFPQATNLSISSSYALINNSTVYKVIAAWSDPSGRVPTRYRAYLVKDGGSGLVVEMDVSGASASIDGQHPGDYIVRVFADYQGGSSIPLEATYTLTEWTTTTPASITMSVSSTPPA